MLTVFIMFGILASAAERERDLFNPARSRSRGLLTGGSASPGPVGLLASAAAGSRSRSRGLLTGGSTSPRPGSGLVSGSDYGPARTCCSILRSNNDTFLHMRGLADRCSNDPGGACTYLSEANLKNNISTGSYCLNDIQTISDTTCCSDYYGALCQRFGTESDTNIEPNTGKCSNECKKIHDCSQEPDHDWCRCSSMSRKPKNKTMCMNTCIPDYVKGLAGLTNTWCNYVYGCMVPYYRVQYHDDDLDDYWACTFGNVLYYSDFDYADCCKEMCTVGNSCYNTLKNCFTNTDSTCDWQCQNNNVNSAPINCADLRSKC